jgi:hypothetical protein
MEKTRQLLESVAENYAVAAKNICKYIEDPEEKKEQLNDLRKLTLEHAQLAHEFDIQEKAVSHVTLTLKDIKDLEIEEVIHFSNKWSSPKLEYKSQMYQIGRI